VPHTGGRDPTARRRHGSLLADRARADGSVYTRRLWTETVTPIPTRGLDGAAPFRQRGARRRASRCGDARTSARDLSVSTANRRSKSSRPMPASAALRSTLQDTRPTHDVLSRAKSDRWLVPRTRNSLALRATTARTSPRWRRSEGRPVRRRGRHLACTHLGAAKH
jgi:hypothetical protein